MATLLPLAGVRSKPNRRKRRLHRVADAWATAQLGGLLVEGSVLDDARLEAGQTIGDDDFDELLERIRDIRASERRSYLKITDTYAASIDYDLRDPLVAALLRSGDEDP